MKQKKILGFLLILFVALVLRVYLILTNMNPIDADQATLGLMSIHILRGNFPIFYYGYPYEGPLEAYLTAPLIAIFGPDRIVIRIVPIIFSLIFVWVTFLLGKSLFSEEVGWYSAIYAAVSPFMLTYRGLTADADYIMLVTVGSLCLLMFHNQQSRPTRGKFLGIIGLLLLGFWFHPVMGYYLIAMVVIWLGKAIKKIGLRRSGQNHLASISLFALSPILPAWSTGWYLLIMIFQTLPILLGFMVPPQFRIVNGIEQSVLNGPEWNIVIILFACFIALIIFWGGLQLIRQGNALLPVFVFITLFIYASFSIIIKLKVDILTLPRFLMPLYSAIPLGVWSMFYITRHKTRLRSIFLAALLSVNLYGNLSAKAAPMPYDLLAWLQNREGKQFVYIDYWIGYWLAFESNEKIIPSIIDDQNQTGFNRYRPYAEQVEKADYPLYIYVSGEENEIEFNNYLSEEGISYQLTYLDKFAIYGELSRHITYPLSRD